jgi:hypothetical protein
MCPLDFFRVQISGAKAPHVISFVTLKPISGNYRTSDAYMHWRRAIRPERSSVLRKNLSGP